MGQCLGLLTRASCDHMPEPWSLLTGGSDPLGSTVARGTHTLPVPLKTPHLR